MNYLNDQNYLNRRSKVWREYAPFYLDYWDSLQCGFSVSLFGWVRQKQSYNERWDKYRLLCVNTNNTVSSFELIDVMYPNAKSHYAPEELINMDGELISIFEQETRTS